MEFKVYPRGRKLTPDILGSKQHRQRGSTTCFEGKTIGKIEEPDGGGSKDTRPRSSVIPSPKPIISIHAFKVFSPPLRPLTRYDAPSSLATSCSKDVFLFFVVCLAHPFKFVFCSPPQNAYPVYLTPVPPVSSSFMLSSSPFASTFFYPSSFTSGMTGASLLAPSMFIYLLFHFSCLLFAHLSELFHSLWLDANGHEGSLHGLHSPVVSYGPLCSCNV